MQIRLAKLVDLQRLLYIEVKKEIASAQEEKKKGFFARFFK
ncbi:hypothetical protein [Sporosarcina globispora]|nr:hypothetical protein [Sporosarcina globispora]